MSSITIKRPIFIAGTGYGAGDVTTSLAFADAAGLVASGDAYWTTTPTGATPLPVSTGEAFLSSVTALTGGTSAAINGYSCAHIATGKTFACVISGQRRCYQLQDATGQTANADSIVSPPDFDATGNNRFLVLIQ